MYVHVCVTCVHKNYSIMHIKSQKSNYLYMYMYVNEGIHVHVQMISQEAMEWELSRAEYDRKIMQLQQQLNDANATRTACDKV